MEILKEWTDGWNAVTLLIGLTLLYSIGHGMRRGASSSARRLVAMMLEGAVTAAALFAAWHVASALSPVVQAWLSGLGIAIPARELGFGEQLYYTFATAVRDFSLLRFSLLFVLAYLLGKQLLYRIADPLVDRWSPKSPLSEQERRSAPSLWSSAIGAGIGAVTGVAWALLLVALLFAVTTLFPQSPAATYIQASSLYQKGAKEIIQPVTGEFLASRLPVFTRAVEEEFASILQRKYEVIDANIPSDIAAAAKQIAADGRTDEEKAKLLYEWVGTRIAYDWEKVRLYEEERTWKEQTPEMTFATRQGVCIDYSRLYAVMARSVGLEVKVVTGLGYDGRGGYGPHAWNEVYLSEQQRWAPLDSTWVSSGGNWFDPPNFEETHIKEA